LTRWIAELPYALADMFERAGSEAAGRARLGIAEDLSAFLAKAS